MSHAINLGLDCAYIAAGGPELLASQLGVQHSNRWLGSGAAIGVQALILVAVDLIGVTRSQRYHAAFVEGFAPTFSVTRSARGDRTRGDETQVGFVGKF